MTLIKYEHVSVGVAGFSAVVSLRVLFYIKHLEDRTHAAAACRFILPWHLMADESPFRIVVVGDIGGKQPN
jgi:hypothetical protein